MTRIDQIEFIYELTQNVARKIVEHIKKNHIPENWDSYELKQYLADCFKNEAFINNL